MKILVIEDSRTLRESVQRAFTQSGDEVTVAADGDEGLDLALGGPWDVVILDLMLPGKQGLEVLSELRGSGSKTNVLILTALGAVEDRVRGLQAGADDYLGKPFVFEELQARVRALTRRRCPRGRSRLTVGRLEVDAAGRCARVDGQLLPLTNREYRLLEYLAYRAGETVSRAEIEDHLYGSRNLPLSNVVDVAVCSLRAKLKELGAAPLIHTRPRRGYVLSVEAS